MPGNRPCFFTFMENLFKKHPISFLPNVYRRHYGLKLYEIRYIHSSGVGERGRYVHVDCEVALYTTVPKVFPDIQVCLCYFHITLDYLRWLLRYWLSKFNYRKVRWWKTILAIPFNQSTNKLLLRPFTEWAGPLNSIWHAERCGKQSYSSHF